MQVLVRRQSAVLTYGLLYHITLQRKISLDAVLLYAGGTDLSQQIAKWRLGSATGLVTAASRQTSLVKLLWQLQLQLPGIGPHLQAPTD